jgi:hypothetical protein
MLFLGIQESTIVVRPALQREIKRCVQICNDTWGNIFYASESMLEKRRQAFFEGGIVVALVDGVVEGYLSFQQVNEPEVKGTWNQITDFGNMSGTHQANGDWIMGLGLAVTPEGTHKQVTRHLIKYAAKYILKNQKKGAMVITRMSDYSQHSHKYSPLEYAKIKKNKMPIDKSLRFFHRYGFRLPETPNIIDDYVDSGGDPNSLGASVVIVKENPYAQTPKFVAKIAAQSVNLVTAVDGWKMSKKRKIGARKRT